MGSLAPTTVVAGVEMGKAEEDKLLAQNRTEVLGGTAIKPKGWDRTGMEAFKYLLYNPETGEILTRTPLSWLKIFTFYIIYYSCLAGFWAACLCIFFLTIPLKDDGPKFQLDYSRIGEMPGVGLRPGPTDNRIDSQMFFLKRADSNMTHSEGGEGDMNIDYAERMKMNIEKYYSKKYNTATGEYEDNSELKLCGENKMRGTGVSACKFDFSTLQECGKYPHGFVNDGNQNIEPCVFLKLNKIYGWEPKPIDPAEAKEEEEMTDELKEIIKNAADKNQIWFDCRGRFAADKEALKMTFYPESQGIPIKYFPFQGGDYEPPLVAVKLHLNEKASPVGQLIHVECRAWYDGVKHITRDKTGMVMFEVILNEVEGDPKAVPEGE